MNKIARFFPQSAKMFAECLRDYVACQFRDLPGETFEILFRASELTNLMCCKLKCRFVSGNRQASVRLLSSSLLSLLRLTVTSAVENSLRTSAKACATSAVSKSREYPTAEDYRGLSPRDAEKPAFRHSSESYVIGTNR